MVKSSFVLGDSPEGGSQMCESSSSCRQLYTVVIWTRAIKSPNIIVQEEARSDTRTDKIGNWRNLSNQLRLPSDQ
jgi:hypothetical protein